jgi:hypothetical protein
MSKSRCGGCDKPTSRVIFIPWYRCKAGPQTTGMGFCPVCAGSRHQHETGRALSLRLICKMTKPNYRPVGFYD